MNPLTKICIDCNIKKEVSEFWIRKQCPDGLCKFCKDCGKKRNSERYHKNKEELTLKNKIYRENNKEKIKEKNKEIYEKNKDIRLEYAKIRRLQIKENVKENGLSLPNINEKKCI